MHGRLRGLVGQQGEVTRAQSLAHGANPQSENVSSSSTVHPAPAAGGQLDHMGFWQSPDHGRTHVHLMEDPCHAAFVRGLIALIAALCLLVSGCGSDEPSGSEKPKADKASATADATAGASAKAKPTKKKPSGTTINITFKGDTVDPNGVEKKVKAGKPITLHIVADKPGELHVHSSPEQEIEYDAGTSTRSSPSTGPASSRSSRTPSRSSIVVLEVR